MDEYGSRCTCFASGTTHINQMKTGAQLIAQDTYFGKHNHKDDTILVSISISVILQSRQLLQES